jgi:hypothetical protein
MPDLLTPRQRSIAYLVTAIGNGALIPIQAAADTLPLWALSLIGAWNAGVAALALSHVSD